MDRLDTMAEKIFMDFGLHDYTFDFLSQSARVYPEKTALIFQKQRLSYKQINDHANALAHAFIRAGVRTGDRVLLLLENGPEYVISYYGILKAGAVAVPVNTDIKTGGLSFLIEDTGAKTLICSSRFQPVINQCGLKNTGIELLILCGPPGGNSHVDFNNMISWSDIIGSEDLHAPDVDLDRNALASIIYTSGSTGKPKGVMITHSNIVSNTHAICRSLRLSDKDIQMIVLPFFYVMGKSLLNTHFAVGGTIVINNTFVYATTVLNQMVEEKVTGFSGVPSTYAFLLHRSPLAGYREKLTHLRYCSQAGGHMARQLKMDLRQTLPDHTEIFIMYGATEASARLTCLDPTCYENKMDSVGKPIQGTTVDIVDESGQPLPAGVTGELLAFGPGIMAGYWNNPQATAQVLSNGRYRTGDLGYRDEDGFIFITGRKDNQLKVGGNRVNTQEIEDLILETGLVIEAFVTGIPDTMLGHKLMAIAVAKNKHIDSSAILATCNQLMPRYKIPVNILLTPSLPKTSSGKIDKQQCVALIFKNLNIAHTNDSKGLTHEQH